MSKQVVYIISSMRSGSTLLKTLLSTRPDVSNLPEVNFHQAVNLAKLSNKRIVVLKSPAFYAQNNYPIFPSQFNQRIIVLVRNPYDTILSLHKMNLKNNLKLAFAMKERELLNYWIMVYSNILNKIKLEDKNIMLVRYEDIIKYSKQITSDIFSFVGSVNVEGTDHYKNPEDYNWKWGSDDGGDIIKTLKIQDLERKQINEKLKKIISSDSRAQFLLKEFGY